MRGQRERRRRRRGLVGRRHRGGRRDESSRNLGSPFSPYLWSASPPPSSQQRWLRRELRRDDHLASLPVPREGGREGGRGTDRQTTDDIDSRSVGRSEVRTVLGSRFFLRLTSLGQRSFSSDMRRFSPGLLAHARARRPRTKRLGLIFPLYCKRNENKRGGLSNWGLQLCNKKKMACSHCVLSLSETGNCWG